ncbi:hypothetical protein RFI_10126, partial [Reticulomyxa filosa]
EEEEEDNTKSGLKNFLIRYCRLQGMLYSRVGMEKFEFLTAQCMMDFQLLMEDGAITPRLAMQMITFLMFVMFHCHNAFVQEHIVEIGMCVYACYVFRQQKARDDSSKKPTVTPTVKTAAILESVQSQTRRHAQDKVALPSTNALTTQDNSSYPFGVLKHIGTIGRKALDLMLDVIAYLLQDMCQNLERLPFLSCVAVGCCWLSKYPLLVRDNPSESAKFFCHQLLEMANIVVFHSYIIGIASTFDVSALSSLPNHEQAHGTGESTNQRRDVDINDNDDDDNYSNLNNSSNSNASSNNSNNNKHANSFASQFDKDDAAAIVNELKGFAYLERLPKLHAWFYKHRYHEHGDNANFTQQQRQRSLILPWLLDKILVSATILLDRDPLQQTSFAMPKLPGSTLPASIASLSTKIECKNGLLPKAYTDNRVRYVVSIFFFFFLNQLLLFFFYN